MAELMDVALRLLRLLKSSEQTSYLEYLEDLRLECQVRIGVELVWID